MENKDKILEEAREKYPVGTVFRSAYDNSMKDYVRNNFYLYNADIPEVTVNHGTGSRIFYKGVTGYKLTGEKQSIPVLQYNINSEYINEYLGCKEAALFMQCTPGNIRRCCVGLSKSAKGFKWKYKIKSNE